MRHSLLIFCTAILVLASCSSPHQWHGSPYQTKEAAANLPLTRTDGESFSLEEHRGQVVLLFFGYTHCPDICPATLAELRWVKDQIGASGDALTVIFVSIDPNRDSHRIIRSYLDRFDDSFIGLSGTPAELEAATGGYGVVAEQDPGDSENYTMTHTSRVFLIDPSGNLRTNYTFDEPRESILADVRFLLEE